MSKFTLTLSFPAHPTASQQVLLADLADWQQLARALLRERLSVQGRLHPGVPVRVKDLLPDVERLSRGRPPRAIDYAMRALGDALQVHQAKRRPSGASPAGCLSVSVSVPNLPFLIGENLLLLPELEAIEVDAFTLPTPWRAAVSVPGNQRL